MHKLLFAFFLLALLIVPACQTESPSTESEKNSVITSFYPLYFLAGEIAKGNEQVEIVNLVPLGAEPHDFEPSPDQMAQVENADLILVQGGLESWFEAIELELEKNAVPFLELNGHLDLMVNGEGGEEHHDHGAFDPHTWLDPILMVEMVDLIQEALVEMDPENEDLYVDNGVKLKMRFDELDASFASQLKDCQIREFVTSHDAFGYLAKRYNLTVLPISGISPFDEPSAQTLAALIDLVKEKGIQHIYFEVLANPEVAQVLAEEAELTPLVLNPVEGLQTGEAGDYFSIMESNLNNLKTGLLCQ